MLPSKKESSCKDRDESEIHTPYTEEIGTENSLGLLMEEATKLISYQIGVGINTYYYPCIIVLGLIGTIMTLSVMLQKKNRTLAPCIYFISMAANDLLTVTVGLVQVGYVIWSLVFSNSEIQSSKRYSMGL